jgi:2-dehydro-3-deoxyphosphooctonate aldolase (KDO 8-P synthase)
MQLSKDKPVIIAGPCAAESYDLMDLVAENLVKLSAELGFHYVFKASFDKANRTSALTARGPGFEQAMGWFERIKKKYEIQALTDVHETYQVKPVSEVCDWIQIPAFLCRQTDLVVEAAARGTFINIKKGQFLAPDAMKHIADKAKVAAAKEGRHSNIYVTERGVTFGYGNLVVDMRSFPIISNAGYPVILDITHSTQLPQGAGDGSSSGAQRKFAPVLARAAAATGYLSGFFLEVHKNPAAAISDKEAQLNIDQGAALLRQLIPLWKSAREFKQIDPLFES